MPLVPCPGHCSLALQKLQDPGGAGPWRCHGLLTGSSQQRQQSQTVSCRDRVEGGPCHVGPKAVLLVPHISLPLCLRHPFLGGSDFIPESDQAVDTTLFSQFPIYPQMPTCDTSKILSFPIAPLLPSHPPLPPLLHRLRHLVGGVHWSIRL